MYQRILVPFDGSATSSRGLDEAIGIATLTGASLRLIHMLDILEFTRGFETAAVYTDHVIPFMRRTGQDILQAGKTRAEKAGVQVDTLLLEGMKTRLCDAVAEQAKAWGAELIVIGTHGRRGVGRVLLGSDAEQIVRTAPVPVLLVRAPEGAADVPTSAQAAVDSVKDTVVV
jgi:nucleotide-binding universal stress UspA family protein